MCRQELKSAVIDGVTPFQKITGTTQFGYFQKDPELRKIFNDAMSGGSVVSLRMILRSYTGFQGIGTLVDVGGGTGTALQTIISKFPAIKGINFDLPHIVSDAPPIPGYSSSRVFNLYVFIYSAHPFTHTHTLRPLPA